MNKRLVIRVYKDPGVDPQHLTNQEKTKLIDALRQTYRLCDLLKCLFLSKSSYFYHHSANIVDKYAALRIKIKTYFLENYSCFGYRRMYDRLIEDGVNYSEKVIRRIMKEENLNVHMRRKRKYNAYQGEITP
ncbi:IS3 family transposase [Paenibacillus sp. FA6]|uniref:IS3 family transposase n=1 Tax=Paenibacillus sp. FA6 TaxID=3413029 RepID=UPI003F65548C